MRKRHVSVNIQSCLEFIASQEFVEEVRQVLDACGFHIPAYTVQDGTAVMNTSDKKSDRSRAPHEKFGETCTCFVRF